MQRSSEDKTTFVRIHDGDPEFPGEEEFLKFIHGEVTTTPTEDGEPAA